MSVELLKKDTNQHPKNKFRKRSLNWKNLRDTLLQMILNAKNMEKPSALDIEFMERIMLAVTSVNECRYCSYYHTKIALENNCTNEEIRELLGGDFSCADQEELPALAFAQHFAEVHCPPTRGRFAAHGL